jgi:two-component system NtrC family sensor kinase
MYKILYVENYYPEFKIMEFTFKHYSFEIFNAVNSLDAIEKLKQITPDIIIISQELPDIQGIELSSIIRNDSKFNNIPIIILGINHSEEIIELAKIAGCVKYFKKPVDLITFPDDIKRIIESPKINPKIFNKNLANSLKKELEKNKSLQEQLNKNEMKFSKILSNLTDPIIITDNTLKIIYFNDTLKNNMVFQEYYNRTNNFFEIFDLLNDDIDNIKKELENNKKVLNIELKLSSNKEKFFFANFSTFEENILISLREFTNEIEFNRKYTHIDKMATVGKITAGIVHEIKNPLTAIKNYLEILKISNDLPKQSMEIINKIEYGFSKIDVLSKSLMSFSRQSNEKMYPLNMNNLIKEVLSFSAYEIQKKDISIQMELDENIPMTLAVKTEIEQVILNLLINASHSLKNVKEPQIKIKTFKENNFVCISVIDNGCGIPNNILDKIFEPFFTTKEQDEGTGLGLSMVKSILNRHNATINVQSNNKGTNFTIKMYPFKLENNIGKS